MLHFIIKLFGIYFNNIELDELDLRDTAWEVGMNS